MIQSRGVGESILIAGKFDQVNGRPSHNLARLYEDGSLDESFDPGNFAASLAITGLVPQPSGKIVVGGSDSRAPQPGGFGLARLNSNGSIDTTFTNSPCLAVSALGMQPDTSIIALGEDLCGAPGQKLIRIQGDPQVRFTLISSRPDGSTRLVLDSSSPTAINLQASSDFRVWVTLGRIEIRGCPVTFVDSTIQTNPRRFYRVQSLTE